MTYLRNAWYAAAWGRDLAAGQPAAMRILDEPLVIYRRSDGGITTLEDRCVHRLAPLSLGRCEGDAIRCMYHGFLYAPDGRVVEIPAQDRIPDQARVRAYPAVERHSLVWVWMGEPAKADEALIPSVYALDDPGYLMGGSQIDYAAEAELINDNLLDFSHVSFVHAASFKAANDFTVNIPEITVLDRGVRFERWIRGSTGGLGDRVEGLLVDRWTAYDYLIPGVLVMWNGSYPLGTADALGGNRPDYSQAIRGVQVHTQAVTPMGPRSARYFFASGPRRDHGDERMREALLEVAAEAFAEDRLIIEAQQKVIDATPQPRMMPSIHDRGVTLFNRLVESLAREERAVAVDA
jgi:vanillate O-demethylase monooxygenase subunit